MALFALAILATTLTGHVADASAKTAHKVKAASKPKVVQPASLASGQMGFVLLDPESGQVVVSQAKDQPFIPASTVKLLTAWMALKVLGPEHRFSTDLVTNAKLVDGTLQGDLSIVGTGDPKLVMDDIRAMVADLAAQGVRRVSGRLLVDDGSLPLLLRLDPGQPPQSPTNAGVGALSAEFNRVTVGWQKRGKDKPVTTWISPEADNLRAAVIKSAGLGRDAITPLVDKDGGTTFQMADDRSQSGALSFPVSDPGLQAGVLFKTAAGVDGIALPDPVRGTLTNGRILVHHESLPLRELVTAMLHFSNNQMAELLGLATAKTLTGTPSSLQAAATTVGSELAKDVPAFAGRTAYLVNLSGLSARSRLTPMQLASLLRTTMNAPDGDAFMAMLAEGGLSGTLRGRLKGADTLGRVHAKTGTMAYVSSLAGYLDAQSGHKLVFAIMCLDAGARATYDAQSGDRKPMDGPALRWIETAKKVQDQMVTRWIESY